ncbi:hypothetical protein AYI69_g2696 [Smittium culicis]|uniref:Uncharacterized protein n=1 Tax=Smittium culicis TaxID=133412 RepID=A0A1R1YLX3_9FUNG|nr:hypothetical protein AYI69_g2696 [Smittium culicis]
MLIEFCKAGRILFNDWRRMHSFYPQSAKKPFPGYHYVFNGLGEDVAMGTEDAYKDIKNIEDGFEDRIKNLRSRLTSKRADKNIHVASDRVEEEEAGAGTGGNTSKKDVNTFRGIKFDMWKDVFIKVCDSFNRAIQQERQANGGFAAMVYRN